MQKIETKIFTLSNAYFFFKESCINMTWVYIQYSIRGIQEELFTQSSILDIYVVFKFLVLQIMLQYTLLYFHFCIWRISGKNPALKIFADLISFIMNSLKLLLGAGRKQIIKILVCFHSGLYHWYLAKSKYLRQWIGTFS